MCTVDENAILPVRLLMTSFLSGLNGPILQKFLRTKAGTVSCLSIQDNLRSCVEYISAKREYCLSYYYWFTIDLFCNLESLLDADIQHKCRSNYRPWLSNRKRASRALVRGGGICCGCRSRICTAIKNETKRERKVDSVCVVCYR